MRTKRAANVFLTVFLAVMIPFSLFADDLYRMTLPGVVVENPRAEKGIKEVELADGSVIEQGYAMLTVPAGAVKETIPETGEPEATVFLLNETEDGFYVTEQVVEIEKKPDDRVEIKEGLRNKDTVVYASDREFVDGDKVKVIVENEQTKIHTARKETYGDKVDTMYLKKRLHRNFVVGIMMLFLTAGLIVVWKRVIPKRFRFLGYGVTVLWTVLLCLCIKEFVVIPAEWIPRRLVDWGKWLENIRLYSI